MRQLILPEDWDGGPSCLIEGGRAHYLARVLRIGPGDSFPGRDSSGRPWTCSVTESGPGRILLSISPGQAETEGAWPGYRLESLPRILLVQGLPKGAKMDLVIRQAAEAGVAAVLPLVSARAVPRGEEGGGTRMARWERIVREALQQSGSDAGTEVAEPLTLPELPAALASRGLSPSDPRILLHEAPLAQSSMHGYLTGAPGAVALCVGPEGGFAQDEVDFLLREGFRPLRLAGAVLRAETAALYAVAAAQIILSERSSWIPKPP
jgi:16S rRNA (uracil1498-N3)-methyltransferase